MCAVADCYGIPGLKILAQCKLREAVRKHWDCLEFAQVLELACKPQLSVNAIVLGTIMDVINIHPSVLDKPEIAVILCKAPEFTFALLRQANKRPSR
jgi:hypothetical protein